MVPRPPATDPTDPTEGNAAELAAVVTRQAGEITELTRQVAELTERRTTFLAAWAHELKTPLTVLQVYLETLRDDLGEGLSDEQMAFVGICHESVLRLRRLVLDLMDVAALDSGKVPIEAARVELPPLLEALAGEARQLADRAGVAVGLELASSPAVRADAARLRQVVRNLIDNAVAATPPGGTVTVRAATRGESVELTVTDTGIGIPADRREAIFEEFVSFPTGSAGRGSGLGLSICRRLVAAMGGQIAVDSEEGAGSTFAVRLPAWRGSNPDDAARHAS
jgi:two-component system sensor histidine kinase BaeS